MKLNRPRNHQHVIGAGLDVIEWLSTIFASSGPSSYLSIINRSNLAFDSISKADPLPGISVECTYGLAGDIAGTTEGASNNYVLGLRGRAGNGPHNGFA